MRSKTFWVRSHFDGKGYCRHNVEGTEERCTQFYENFSNLTNAETHIKKKHHEFAGKLHPDGTMAADDAFANPLVGSGLMSTTDLWIALLAMENLPARIVDNPLFRHLTKVKISRNAVRGKLEANASTAWAKASKQVKTARNTCTLAFDIGTTNRRYLAFVVLRGGVALYHSCIADEDPRVNGHFTCANVRQVVLDVIAGLKETQGLRVTAIVADNASNLQGIANVPTVSNADNSADWEDATEMAAVETLNLPFLVRCICHVIQLIVKDAAVRPLWEPGLDLAKTYAATFNVNITPNETRWNSAYTAILDVKAHMHQTRYAENDTANLIDLATLENISKLLAPFAYATRVVERDSATLWDSLVVLQSLRHHFLEEARIDNDARATIIHVIDKRHDMLCRSPAYVLIALFSPQGFAAYDGITPGYELLMKNVVEKILKVPSIIPATEVAAVQSVPFESNSSARVTREAYDANLRGEDFQRMIPNVVQLIEDLLDATPSEAAVERMFSKMGLAVGDLQASMATDTVEARLRLSSACNVFMSAFEARRKEQVARAEREAAEELAAAEAKRARPEPAQPQASQPGRLSQVSQSESTHTSLVTPSPSPRAPRTVAVSAVPDDDVTEVAAPMKLLMDIDFMPALMNAHSYYVLEQKQVPGARPAEPAEPADGRVTRNTCFKCKASMSDDAQHHGVRMYVSCGNTSCFRKASAWHFPHRLNFTSTQLKQAIEMPPKEDGSRRVDYTCAQCSRAIVAAATPTTDAP